MGKMFVKFLLGAVSKLALPVFFTIYGKNREKQKQAEEALESVREARNIHHKIDTDKRYRASIRRMFTRDTR